MNAIGGVKGIVGIVGLLVALALAYGTVYTVPEGHVGIVKRFQKAVKMVDPGLHVKVPVVDRVEEMEVRQRKNVEELVAATANQLRIDAKVSINWTVNREAAMDLFVRYGGLPQFESRILDPKLRSAAKAALSKYAADALIRDRQQAVGTIMDNMVEELADFPITVNSPQIENITFPSTYMEAVLQKEQAREGAEREKHNLERQRLVALQAVNTAQAEHDAKKLAADAEAYRTLTEAEAEAKAIALVNEQLARSPAYVDLVRAKAWNGVMPQTMLGEGVSVFFGVAPATHLETVPPGPR